MMNNVKICVIGLGYVGLPLAVAFSRKFDVLGFDINQSRIEELKQGRDWTQEVPEEELESLTQLTFSHDEQDLKSCNVFIVTVPTPIDNHRQPDLTPLIKASELVGRNISKDGLVIYESTVYPGATEEDCIPIVEKVSGLKFNTDFYAGYSPERINPGDKSRPVTQIVKVTSGSTPEVAEFVNQLYGSIIVAGTYIAKSIRVAEASKIIENTQRDVNIALINELSMIFSNLNIDTNDVIEAASTKWNFIKLHPGLVGGHCIGVDPYYLVHKSMAVGHIPDIIRTAREINDGMAKHVAMRFIQALIAKDVKVKGSRVLLMGLAFKENCPDLRNTKVADLVRELELFGLVVDVYDPVVNPDDAIKEYGIRLIESPKFGDYCGAIVAVAHNDFVGMLDELGEYSARGFVLFDMKDVCREGVDRIRM